MNRLPSITAAGRLAPFLVLALLVLEPRAYAHVAKGPMPDAVAEMEYRILLEFKPRNVEVRNKLGMVLYRSNKLSEAAAEFTTVLQTVPNNFDALDGLGLVLLGQQEFDRAEACFREALAIDPDDGLTHYHLGQALEGKGDYPAAAEAYQTALQKNNLSEDDTAGHTGKKTIEQTLKTLNEKIKEKKKADI